MDTRTCTYARTCTHTRECVLLGKMPNHAQKSGSFQALTHLSRGVYEAPRAPLWHSTESFADIKIEHSGVWMHSSHSPSKLWKSFYYSVSYMAVKDNARGGRGRESRRPSSSVNTDSKAWALGPWACN